MKAETHSPDESVVRGFSAVHGGHVKLPLVQNDDLSVFRACLRQVVVLLEPREPASEVEAKEITLRSDSVVRGVELQQVHRSIRDSLDAAVVRAVHVHGSNTAPVRAELLDYEDVDNVNDVCRGKKSGNVRGDGEREREAIVC